MGKTKRNYGKERRARADRRKVKDLNYKGSERRGGRNRRSG